MPSRFFWWLPLTCGGWKKENGSAAGQCPPKEDIWHGVPGDSRTHQVAGESSRQRFLSCYCLEDYAATDDDCLHGNDCGTRLVLRTPVLTGILSLTVVASGGGRFHNRLKEKSSITADGYDCPPPTDSR